MPVSLSEVPKSQSRQTDRPRAVWYLPAAQSLHDVLFSSGCALPTGQLSQRETRDVLVLKVPFSQSVQRDCDELGMYEP